MIHDLIVCDKARVPVMWVVTHEELRAERAIQKYVIDKHGGQVWIWSLTSAEDGTRGWQTPEGTRRTDAIFNEDDSADPTAAVSSVIEFATDPNNVKEKIIVVFRDPHYFVKEDASFCRILRDASFKLKKTNTSIVCLSPEEKLPSELQKDIEIIHPGLPNKDVLLKVVNQQIDGMEGYLEEQYDNNFKEKVAQACCGLTLNQATDAIAKSVAKNSRKIDINYINEVKTKTLSALPGMTYIGKVSNMSDVGGLAGVKEFVEDRKDGFSPEAREFGLPVPRGFLMAGISGCGKSLTAKTVAAEFGLPLIKLDIPGLKDGIVGSTEKNWRMASQAIEAIGHCCVWVDELEKSVQGSGERNSDGGSSAALLQGILHFMEERDGGSFFVATGNEIDRLPPELLRKGRWDAIFFVDLPTVEERKEIVEVHLRRVKRELPEKEIQRIAEATENRSGAEIAAGVTEGLWRAFRDGRREMTGDDIISCIEIEVALAETMKEKVSTLREWAKTRARLASATIGESHKTKAQKKKVALEVVEENWND